MCALAIAEKLSIPTSDFMDAMVLNATWGDIKGTCRSSPPLLAHRVVGTMFCSSWNVSVNVSLNQPCCVCVCVRLAGTYYSGPAKRYLMTLPFGEPVTYFWSARLKCHAMCFTPCASHQRLHPSIPLLNPNPYPNRFTHPYRCCPVPRHMRCLPDSLRLVHCACVGGSRATLR